MKFTTLVFPEVMYRMFHRRGEISHGCYTTDTNTDSDRAFTINCNEIINYKEKEMPENLHWPGKLASVGVHPYQRALVGDKMQTCLSNGSVCCLRHLDLNFALSNVRLIKTTILLNALVHIMGFSITVWATISSLRTTEWFVKTLL